MLKICWFTTGRDEEALILLKDACDALDRKIIDGMISVLFINREKGESLPSDEIFAYAGERNIPIEALSSKRFLKELGLTLNEGRPAFDRAVKSKIKGYDFDVIFLAGYMLVLTPELVDSFLMLNLHPSLPGGYKGKWEDVINGTIDDGRRDFGAMIHVVSSVLDEGAPLTYVKLELSGPGIDDLYAKAAGGEESAKKELFTIMRREEFAIERPLITKTLSLLSRGIVEIRYGSVRFEGKPVEGGIDITGEVAG